MLIITTFMFLDHQGRRDDPAQQEIELTTMPSVDNGTHWGQQVLIY